MTAREKLTVEHPEKLDDLELGGCMGCPEDYGYLPDADFCTNNYDRYGSHSGAINDITDLFERCKKCWDREIPEEMKEEKEDNMSECSMKIQCNNCIHEEVCCLKGTLLDTKNELEHIEIPAFLHPIKLECTHYSPKNRTFTK